MKRSPDEPGLLYSVVMLFMGGWIAIECAGALLDLTRYGVFKIPAFLVKGPDGVKPWLLFYATEPVWTVAMTAVTTIAGLLGICATIFAITDLWKRFTPSEGA